MSPSILWELAATGCLAVHLGFMNLSAALPLFASILPALIGRTQPAVAVAYGNQLARQGILMLVLGSLSGLLLAGVMWLAGDRAFFRLMTPFAYKIHWALWELVFYLVCMSLFVCMGRAGMVRSRSARVTRHLLAVLAATNLLYHFPPLFAVMARAANDPQSITGPVGPREFRQLMLTGHVVALTVHFGLAALAVTAVALLPQIVRRIASDTDVSCWRLVQRVAAGIALAVSLLQLVVGLWLLMQLDPLSQRRLMGADVAGTLALGGSVLAAFGLLHLLAAATMGELSLAAAHRLNLAMAVIVLLMSFTLRRLDASPATAYGTGANSTIDLPSTSTARTTLSWPPKAIDLPSRSRLTT